MKTCPICQQAYSDDVEFCARDGARLAGGAREERECPYCAERILKKARVCKHCGRDVEPLAGNDMAVKPPVPVPCEQPIETPAAKPAEIPPAAAVGPPPPPPEPPQFVMMPEGPSKMKYVAIGLAAVMVIAIGSRFCSQHGAKNGEVRVNPKDGLKYVWIPPGNFAMGCSPGDNDCYDFEKPSHPVNIVKGFWLGQTAVTVAAYKGFAAAAGRSMPPEPLIQDKPLNSGWADLSMPIVDVTWEDAKSYCQWAGGTLPTEAEWEYAARAGSTAVRYGDLDAIAWFADNSGQERFDSEKLAQKEDQAAFMKRLSENGNSMHEVGQKTANGFGLFDTLGNVWEWVNDWWEQGYYQNSPPQDPSGPSSGHLRVLRGGSWVNAARDIRVSLRNKRDPGSRDFDVGFRCGGDMDIP